MLNRFLKWFFKPETSAETFGVEDTSLKKRNRLFDTDFVPWEQISDQVQKAWDYSFAKAVAPEAKMALDTAVAKPMKEGFKFAMDNFPNFSVKSSFYGNEVIPPQMMLWYANQTFIGYQLCAMLAQNWLISKACLMPAEDAIRKGYEITINDGTDADPKILDRIRELDVEYQVNANLIQFIQFGRIFGIRIAMFKVESTDPDYYFKPFNEDGVTPGSYKGISQIDPYWVTPQLDPQAAGDPSSRHFYEPTWWNIAGKLVHRSHLVIARTEELADILKPAYIYGGIPIPQKIYSRVYAAERTANEAPMLALTKRTDVIKADMTEAVAQPMVMAQKIQNWVYNRDNYGIKTIGLEEDMLHFETSLTDLDAVIMTQYQLVAAAANVPATKLLGTTPKGFNATGEYEESSYHEMLESLQAHWGTPLLERHHLLLMRSSIAPEFGIAPIKTTVTWKPLDAMTAKEQAELNKMKAETGATLMTTGAIDGEDERNRVISDPDSGYTGVEDTETENKEGPEPSILNDPDGGEPV